jgi:hypothetical protein
MATSTVTGVPVGLGQRGTGTPRSFTLVKS